MSVAVRDLGRYRVGYAVNSVEGGKSHLRWQAIAHEESK